jgi:hypothetical protein
LTHITTSDRFLSTTTLGDDMDVFVEQAGNGKWFVSQQGWGRSFESFESAETHAHTLLDSNSALVLGYVYKPIRRKPHASTGQRHRYFDVLGL